MQLRPGYVFAALDAAEWLHGAGNPWANRMDLDRMGVFGHSAGSEGVLLAANLAPAGQFDAVVAADGYGIPPASIPLGVPTMIQFGENQASFYPYPQRFDPMLLPPVANAERLRAAGTPMMSIGLRGSTHNEWMYVPYRLVNPVAPLTNASARGQQIAVYYTLAWFDLHLKGDSSAHADDAEARLLARNFDDSVDRSAIGVGTWNPLTQSNVPYRIEGERVEDHLTVWYPSRVSFGGHACPDWQTGCTTGN